MNNEDVFSKLRNKLPQVAMRSLSEMAAIQKQDTAIQCALLTWRGKAVNGMHRLLKTPTDTEFTHDELDLAGWVNEYASQANISFASALDQLFEFLKRYPKSLERYTNGEANFAESTNGVSGLNLPYGWNSNPQLTESFRRARVYQAGHPGCDLVGAVIEVDKPEAEVRAQIKKLEIENAQLRAGLEGRVSAAR